MNHTHPALAASRSRVLHVGCGGDCLPDWIDGEETRLDIDPKVKPDVVASMTNMGEIGEFEIVYSSHALEHLHLHEVKIALKEFHRVLGDGGRAMVIVPDLEDARPTSEVLFNSPAGPVTGLDLFFGMQSLVAGNPYMAHHYGFVSSTLEAELLAAGFRAAVVKRLPCFNLFAVGVK